MDKLVEDMEDTEVLNNTLITWVDIRAVVAPVAAAIEALGLAVATQDLVIREEEALTVPQAVMRRTLAHKTTHNRADPP